MKEQKKPISQLFVSVVVFGLIQRGKKFGKVFTGFAFIARDGTCLFSIISMSSKFIGIFEIRNSPIEIYFIEHNLLFSIILFL